MPDRLNSSAAIKAAPLPAAFYETGADRPTIHAFPRSWSHAWSTISAALANHYGADVERFHTAEAYWNGDREFATHCYDRIMTHKSIVSQNIQR
jgi:hypothetical protein